MAAENFNSITGYSVGIPPVEAIDANGNVVTNVNALSGNVAANAIYANSYYWANGHPYAANPGGSNTQLQYNANGEFGGIPNVTWNGNILSLGNVANLQILGGLDGYVLQTDGTGNLSWTAQTGSGGNGAPGGANTQVQFNNAGSFAGVSGFTFNTQGNILTVPNVLVTGTLNANIPGSNIIGPVNLANFATVANSVAGANVSGAVANANFALYSGISTVANTVAGGNVTGAVAFATVANSVAGANVSGAVNYATVANSVAGANVIGQVSFANVANHVAGANVSGQVEFAAIANSVAGGNVYGQVEFAAIANSVAGANVTGEVEYAAIANLVLGSNVSGQVGYAAIANQVAGSNVIGYVANATHANTASALNASVNNVVITGGNSGQYLQTNGLGNLTWATVTGGNGSPGGSNTYIQFNNAGAFGGIPGFTINSSTQTMGMANANVLGTLRSNVINATGNITANAFIGNGAPLNLNTSAYTLYVAKNGSDSNDGNINRPFLTIQAGLAAARTLSANGTHAVALHLAPGSYTENMPLTITPNVSLIGDNIRSVEIQPNDPNSDMFYMTNGTYVWGITVKNYKANAFSYNPDGSTCTTYGTVYVSPYIQNITSYTSYPSGPGGTCFSIDGSLVDDYSTKAMILGFATIINQNGIGLSILNNGYSQAVNIYTIYCNTGVIVESGGFVSLNACDCATGIYGLVANGTGNVQTQGTTVGSSVAGIFLVTGLTNGQPNVNTVLVIDGDPNFYTIDTIQQVDSITWRVIVQQVYTKTLASGTNVTFYNRSAIIASAHTFEYVGAGTTYRALPQYGGIPIEANEVIQTNGGVITFTSTDQKGNFKVGSGFTINQATGTITGTDFYESLFAQMTPFILALGSDY